MSLSSGTRIGPYTIDAPLGAGGMGEVYRARDTRLGRDVAVKVIAADSATDPDRLARFEQEARAAAALNHPNILAVFDIGPGSAAHGPYIVSELLEGETLGARLSRGRLPVRTAIELATQVARALAAAHDKGIVHRDLKPDNIFVTRDGTAKVLDFGLAKLRDATPGAGGDASTVTGRPPTAQGAVMGTVGYMAPEQVRGAEVDHRADIFAIGVTLYEMLAGQRAFSGDSGVETLNAILKSEPAEFETLGVPVPAEVARIVAHCLEKHPADRFQSARDLAFHLAGAAGSAGDAQRKAQAPDDAASGRPRRRWALPVGLVAAALAGALVTGGALVRSRTEPTPDPTAFTISGDGSGGPSTQGLSLSPDGRTLALTWNALDGTPQLVVRSLDHETPRLLVGAGSPQVPFFSPDGHHVAYVSGSSAQLMRVPAAGGAPALVAPISGTRYGGVWLPDDRIVYANSGSSDLLAVPARGGPSQAVVPGSAFDGASLRFPTATADGRTGARGDRGPALLQAMPLPCIDTRMTEVHSGVVELLFRRTAALIVALSLGAAGWAECAGWQATAEARSDCCLAGGDCPMHGSTERGAGAERVVTQAQADDCCAVSGTRDSTPSAALFALSTSPALAPTSLSTFAPVAAQPASFGEWRIHAPAPVGQVPRHVLLSVFLI